jgi:uncharacterized hydantoinase/oxoprolinase family protein
VAEPVGVGGSRSLMSETAGKTALKWHYPMFRKKSRVAGHIPEIRNSHGKPKVADNNEIQ